MDALRFSEVVQSDAGEFGPLFEAFLDGSNQCLLEHISFCLRVEQSRHGVVTEDIFYHYHDHEFHRSNHPRGQVTPFNVVCRDPPNAHNTPRSDYLVTLYL